MHRPGPVIKRGSGQAQERTLAADAELGVVVIDQFAQFTGVRAAETIFEPLQHHLQPTNLLEQLGLLGLSVLLVLAFVGTGEQLTGAIEGLPLPLAHLDWVDGVVGGDFLDCLAATDRLHGTLAMNSGLWVRRLLIGGSLDQGRYPASEVNDGVCPEKPSHLTLWLFLGSRHHLSLHLPDLPPVVEGDHMDAQFF